MGTVTWELIKERTKKFDNVSKLNIERLDELSHARDLSKDDRNLLRRVIKAFKLVRNNLDKDISKLIEPFYKNLSR